MCCWENVIYIYTAICACRQNTELNLTLITPNTAVNGLCVCLCEIVWVCVSVWGLERERERKREREREWVVVSSTTSALSLGLPHSSLIALKSLALSPSLFQTALPYKDLLRFVPTLHYTWHSTIFRPNGASDASQMDFTHQTTCN